MLMTKSLAAAYLMTIRNKFLFPINAAGLKLCVGPMPSDAELDSLTQASARITDNVAVTINTTGMTSILKDAAFPPAYLLNLLPTNPTGLATKAGKIEWCVFYHAASNIVVISDVTKSNGGGLVTVDTLDVVVGTPVMLTNISLQVGR